MRSVAHKKDFFRTIDIISKAVGVWLEPETSSTAKRLSHVVWDTFLAVCGTSFIISEFLIIKTIMGELLLLVPHIGMMSNLSVGLFEFTILISNQAKIAKMKNILQSESFNYEEFDGSPKIVEDSKTFYNRITIFTCLCYFMVSISGHLSAIKDFNIETKDGHYGVNATCYDFLPYLFVIPFQTNTLRRCKSAFFVMDGGLLILGGYLGVHDTLLYALSSCINAKFQVISEASKTIRERTQLKMLLPESFSILKDEELPEFEELMYCEIKRCNESLGILLGVCRDLESIFCYTLLGRAISSLLVIASCLYIGSYLSPQDPEIYHLAEYLSAGLFQIFMVCYFGVFITERGAAYNTYLYECNWYSCSPRFKRAMLIMMSRMQKPLYLTIGKFYPLSLEIFVQVWKAAFSYATMLKTL